MTPEQIALIRLTFAQVTIDEETAGRLFYDRLFAIAPDTRAMFKQDMQSQSRKLMHSLAIAISSLRNPDDLHFIVQGLGRRHAKYGVKDVHYDKFAEALLWMFECRLGAAFTREAKEAWSTLYNDLANMMKNAGVAGDKKTVAR